MQREPTWLLIGLLVGVFICLPLAIVKKGFGKVVRISLAGIGCALLVILTLFCLFPAVARVERLYHQGHDQFFWGSRLHSTAPSERQEAANALATLLRSSKSKVRLLVIQDLGECGPTEREIALNALLAFAKDEQEDDFLRWKAEYAIGIMFFQHVVGDIGSEVDREPYQKMILAQGWEAAQRELASNKQAKFSGLQGPQHVGEVFSR